IAVSCGVSSRCRMFFRIKPSGERRYLQIVENTRNGARTVQRVLATLGRVEELQANGKLDVLLRSGARFSETALLISRLQAGTLETSAAVRIGAPMIFSRLWEQTGCRKVIEQLGKARSWAFLWSGRCLPASCIGWWFPGRTAPARSGWMAITSIAPKVWSCTSC